MKERWGLELVYRLLDAVTLEIAVTKVSRPSAAHAAGLGPGHVITVVNQWNVEVSSSQYFSLSESEEEEKHRSDVWTVAGDAGGGVDPLCAGGGRLLPHPGLAAPDAGHGGRDLGAPGGFLMVVCTLA